MRPIDKTTARISQIARTSRSGRMVLGLALALAAAWARVPAALAADWPQFNRDAEHSGNNGEESTLHARNVASLRVRYHVVLPGVADGPPVFLEGVATPHGNKDLLFLTTRKGALLALDAATGSVVWSRQPARRPGYTTSSPAIDPGRQLVYAYGLDGKVHKYAVGDGSEVTTGGWPQIATRKPDVEQGSSALSVTTATGGSSYLYVATGGYPGGGGDYQGHVTTIDLTTGAQRVFNAACSDLLAHLAEHAAPDCAQTQSGVWARAGVAYDPDLDRIFFATGIGSYDADRGGHDWGDSVLALHPDGTGAGGGLPVDAYTPNDFQFLQDSGFDLGSTAPAILPVAPASKYPHLAVQAGREGEIHLLDLDDLSRQGGPGHIAGEVEPVAVPQGGPVLTAPAVWVYPQDGTTWVFTANDNGISAMQLFVDAAGNPTIFTQWSHGGGGTSPVVANGILYYAGSGGLLALDPLSGAQLFADTSLGGIHWQSPIVVDGRVYVTDLSGTLWAYEPVPPRLTLHPLSSSCRLIDTTASADGVYGGPALSGGTTRTYAVAGHCGIPDDALAIAANVTAVRPSRRGFLALGPANVAATSPTLRFRRQTISTPASISLTGNPVGSLSVTAELGGSVDLLVDVTGYYD